MTPKKLSYIWMTAGVILLIIGLFGLFFGSWMHVINVAIAALIIYTSVYQLGGWAYVKHDILWYLKRKQDLPKVVKRKRNHLKAVK